MITKIFSKFNRILFFLIFVSIISFNCGEKEKTEQQVTTKLEESELKFENFNFTKSYKDCQPTSANCSYILFEYSKIKEGDFKDEINKAINDEILKISSEYLSNSQITSLEELSQEFMKEYKNFLTKNPKSETIWMMEVRGRVENYTPKILCYSISNVNYFGGAHPNTKFRYLNFDRKTGKLLTLNDILTIGFEGKLNEILDKIIRQTYMLKPEDNLSEKIGLYENKIEFNNNFAITKHGLKFYYNPYEIAPYSIGFIELIIPYSELEPILPPNSKARQ